jgi:hypothetical protein
MDIKILQPPINRWNKGWISPGAVGSVGDTHLNVRLKHNHPDAPLRWDDLTAGRKAMKFGSNVQDGQRSSFISGFSSAQQLSYNWELERPLTAKVGYRYQDVRAPDKKSETIMGTTPKYPWKNQVYSVFSAKTTGDSFLPSPGGYPIRDQPRGGLYPVQRAVAGGTQPNPSPYDNIVVSAGASVPENVPEDVVQGSVPSTKGIP